MKNILISVVLLSVVFGCTRVNIDQEKRRDLFFKCLDKAAQIAPNETTYNDTAEVIEKCGVEALRLARDEYSYSE